jgi:hypothetical protein
MSSTRYLSDFHQTFAFSTELRKKYVNIGFHEKFVQWESHCGTRTDRLTRRSKQSLFATSRTRVNSSVPRRIGTFTEE